MFSSDLALCSPKGQGGSGLPLAAWALLLGWWCLQQETKSKRVFLSGKGLLFHEEVLFALALATHPLPAKEGPT